MRIVRRSEELVVQFTVLWEVAYLAERGDCWVPFCLVGHTNPIGEIHASSHAVRLSPGYTIGQRQAVTLCRLEPEAK